VAWSQVRPTPPPRGGGYTQIHPRDAWTQVRPNNRAGYRQVNTPNAYARQRLAGLAKRGYTPGSLGITGNAAAQWRAISPIVGALQAIRSGQGASYSYNPGASANSSVAALVQQLLGRGQSAQQLVNPQAPPQQDLEAALRAPGGPLNFAGFPGQ
jgi:hypothetical protein